MLLCDSQTAVKYKVVVWLTRLLANYALSTNLYRHNIKIFSLYARDFCAHFITILNNAYHKLNLYHMYIFGT